jgi:hypothetical protein
MGLKPLIMKKTNNKKPTKKAKNKSSKGMLAKYNGVETKNNIGGTSLKLAVDFIIGALLGAGVGKMLGKGALPVGALLIGGSHYLKEETGIARVAGSAMVAYGIASANQIPRESVKEKLTEFKDEVFSATLLDKIFQKDEAPEKIPLEGFGFIDDSALDDFERNLEQEAIAFEANQNDAPENDLTYTFIDEPDLTSL